MGAFELIIELRRKGCSIVADGGYLDISPADNLSPEMVQQLRQSKAEILAELQRETLQDRQRETRRKKVITLLADSPEIQRAYYTDADSDPDHVILAIGIRHVATFEMLIDRAKYDPFKLILTLGQYGQITH